MASIIWSQNPNGKLKQRTLLLSIYSYTIFHLQAMPGQIKTKIFTFLLKWYDGSVRVEWHTKSIGFEYHMMLLLVLTMFWVTSKITRATEKCGWKRHSTNTNIYIRKITNGHLYITSIYMYECEVMFCVRTMALIYWGFFFFFWLFDFSAGQRVMYKCDDITTDKAMSFIRVCPFTYFM